MLAAISSGIMAGIFLALNRALFARIGMSGSHMAASFWNHCVGALFLLLLIALFYDFSPLYALDKPPLYLYFGGFIGVGIVFLVSLVMPPLGMMKSTVYIISGQIIVGSCIDIFSGKVHSLTFQIIGIALIITGLSFSCLRRNKIGSTDKTDIIK